MTQESMTGRELLRTIRPYWWPYRRQLAAGFVFLILASSLTMVQPWIVKLAIDDLKSGELTRRIGVYAASMIAITALACACRYGMRHKIIGTSRRFEHDLRRRVFEHIQILPKSYFDTVPSGDIMSRLTNDILRVRMVLGPTCMQLGNAVVSLTFALMVMFSIDVELTLISLAPLPLMPIVFYRMGRKIRLHSEKVQEQMADITSCAQENITGIRVVKAYNLEPIESRKFDALSVAYVKRNLELIRYQGLFTPLVVLLSGISTACLLFFCGWWVISDRISLGSMVAFIEYLIILSWPLLAIGWVVGLIQQASAAMVRIQAILNEPVRIGMIAEAGIVSEQSAMDLDGDIEFNQVSFRYHSHQPCVLDDVSFVVRKGETVALIGSSGAGKTTLLSLLTRSYDPTGGSIRINGRNLVMIPEYSVRQSVGIMPQMPVLFSRTILSNLAFGQVDNSPVTIDEAVQIAHIDRDLNEFPDRLETRLGERGVNLSGGQKQRLTLARVLLRNTPILLLDDPFASVDIATEEAILSKLTAFNAPRTLLIVSHRINTAKRADRIIVLDKGRIIEEGTHDELVRNRGYYQALCRKQALLDELDALA
ncbi:ABC transporter ATP-binding protein [bacterium]|nr:ABC transporter ATP-binding protein [candidate division CSSED10-310 bacterium]